MWIRGVLVGAVVLGVAGCSSLPWQEVEERRGDEGVVGKPGTEWDEARQAEARQAETGQAEAGQAEAGQAGAEQESEFSDAPWEEARARGAEIRAIGQEPGWWLEIRRDGSMMLASDYGTRRQVFDRPRAQLLDGGIERFQVAEAGVTITLRDLPCQDVMSGEHMPLTVEVQTPDEYLQGCGRRLAESED